MKLGEYLHDAMRQRWGWGAVEGIDCCKFVAGWVINQGHPDPMGFIRSKYDSERSALLKIARGGGLTKLWTRGMRDAGVPVANGPQAGDVGVIQVGTVDGTHEACGIYVGPRWITLGVRGIHGSPAHPLKLWRP